MDAEELKITCGAVCVYPSRVKETVQFLAKYGASQVYSLCLSQQSQGDCTVPS